ncbi:unnamed protein product [Bursaphelenchus okinawaensis]|uniref:Peptidase A1 domain-containing protein n=1 Tax=Bursaphelenchus okinawaensis TaxID=465554 RepID=A0A811KLX5_9BILA|nr:unnamed protein product [Bursaphelenchus okinawaensis]CAG9105756.1 unnamed protein product [Bursaphelenchus okinawaensis]
MSSCSKVVSYILAFLFINSILTTVFSATVLIGKNTLTSAKATESGKQGNGRQNTTLDSGRYNNTTHATRQVSTSRRAIAQLTTVDGEAKGIKWENITWLANKTPIFTQTLTNINNLYYVGTVYIGFPPRPFQVMFDTGSTLTWVKGKNALQRTDNGFNEVYYNYVWSQTSRTTKRKFKISYDDGVVTKGRLYMDYVALGDYYNPQLRNYVHFGVATKLEQDSPRPYDGVFGLGFGEKHNIKTLMERNRMTNTLNPPIISVYMSELPEKPTESSWGGEIVFGSLNPRWCEAEAVFTQVIHTPDWRFHANHVTLNGINIDIEIEISSDTGTSAILVPKKIYNKITKHLGLRKGSSVPAINCEQKIHLSFKINGVHFSLTEKQLITGYNNKCNLQMSPVQGNLWVFGTPMIRKYCHVYDMQSKRIGFTNTVY